MIRRFLWMIAVASLLSGPAQAYPQKNQNPPAPLLPLDDNQAVENTITEMMGAWQIGDIDMLRKYYAEEVIVVSGLWEPPITRRDQYIAAYLRQRQRVKGVQLNRQNTFIRVVGNVAWAVYMWNFTAEVDGRPMGYRGHTTLVLEKRAGKWLIITNHTSTAEPPAPPQQTPAAQPPAAKPAH